MSNPYAPPEDREREAQRAGRAPEPPAGAEALPPVPPAGAGAPAAPTGTGARPAGTRHGAPYSGPLAAPDRSPEGVPYERPRAPHQDPPASPADVLRVASLLRWTAVLVLVAVVGDLFVFPWFLAAGLVGLGALVVGGRGLALAARTRQSTPRTLLILLVVVALLGLTRPTTALLTWDAEQSYARCQAAALTVQAQNACVSEYQQALDARVAQLKSRAG
ncbi:MAG: hypothetical protein BGO37_04650 [Cellulomonas sp. 73-92]|uniref:hypothetical protein n=1 Tax=Cellulomonas sp. 73-92 TaxID=1895740 RepID=UPI00092852A3|nr:hypothetical protein [Cellulomonas sp. 73-92]OJV82273.1 MAG: hypothetical protein BGO37_04650 [Cellulomonas sp. 73-92]